jgi:SSS family transporter
LPTSPNRSHQPGVAGAFSGISNHAMIIAGGANFSQPDWQSNKQYHDNIYVLKQNGEWLNKFYLDNKIAYGATVEAGPGLVCIGGTNGKKVSSRVFLLVWNPEQETIQQYELPSLPVPLANSSAALQGDYIYVSGGLTETRLSSATDIFLRLNVAELLEKNSSGFEGKEIITTDWEKLSPIPGSKRAFHISVGQHNGQDDCIYIFSGRRYNENGQYKFLEDVWEYNISKNNWRKRANLPRCVMAGTGIQVKDSHIFILGGADGSLVSEADSLKEDHPGFPKEALVYHTITNTWTSGGKTPINQVTTRAFYWNDKIVIPSGEIKPRIRTPKIMEITLNQAKPGFGFINSLTLIIYLSGMILIGVYFVNKNKDTNDYFRGGQQIPWWAAACSIFATMLSSITYMAISAKSYATNWEFLLAYPMILFVALFVIRYILPFFRRIDATSAYEYLEMRFNRTARMIGSGFFIVFQIGRMAIVMFLSALALSTITPLTAIQSILIMGTLSIIYSTLGGVEAVVWTDTIQTFVLLGGALLACGWIFFHFQGGVGEFFQIAAANNKFHMINWDWNSSSYTTAAFWIIVLGALGQNMISYSSDQAVVQRYMTTSNQKRAAKSILTNGIMSQFAGLLFFLIGTALFVFYHQNPGHLDPTFKTDAILPLFIVRELPIGVSGVIIAGIFAAAQSTISTSMNSTSSALITDFSRAFFGERKEKFYLAQARWATVIIGILGTGTALLFATAEIKSLFDQFISIIGLFGASICGLFLLGIFTKKANGNGAIIGAAFGAIILFWVRSFTATHFYIYSTVGIVSTMVIGYFSSFLFFDKSNKEQHTIYYFHNSQ